MPKTVFAIALAVALMSDAAAAAEITPYAAPASRNIFWQGPYVGANRGYQWGLATSIASKPSGVAGGLQSGYSWQIGSFVFGGETDLQLSDADHRFAGWKFSNPWFGTVRGRVGYALNNVMFYGTGGLAFGELRATTFGLTESHTTAGWTLGVGGEMGFAPNWSAKVEYLYVDLSNTNFVVTGASNGYRFGLIRAGVNYRF